MASRCPLTEVRVVHDMHLLNISSVLHSTGSSCALRVLVSRLIVATRLHSADAMPQSGHVSHRKMHLDPILGGLLAYRSHGLTAVWCKAVPFFDEGGECHGAMCIRRTCLLTPFTPYSSRRQLELWACYSVGGLSSHTCQALRSTYLTVPYAVRSPDSASDRSASEDVRFRRWKPFLCQSATCSLRAEQ